METWARILPCTLRPGRRSELEALAEEAHGGCKRKLVAGLLERSRICTRNCRTPCSHDKAIICKGRKGYGLGLFVFSYDQRISNSLWDHHTVLCRGLVVMMPLPEDLKDLEDGARLEVQLLEAATAGDTPLEFAECMPKFWEADREVLRGVQLAFGREPEVIGLEAVMEKVDGSLGLIHPARDPQTLHRIDAFPLLSSKSVGYSQDIAKARSMLEEQHPKFRLPENVTAALVEVVRPEVQVCVPYSYQGFRLLAVMKAGAWLNEEELDHLARDLQMERPRNVKQRGEETLEDILAKAQAYVMGDPHELEEGWVVVLKNGLRLKVHTEAYRILHALWSCTWNGDVTVKLVMPLLRHPAVKEVPFSSLRRCLCHPRCASPAMRRTAADAEQLLFTMRGLRDLCCELTGESDPVWNMLHTWWSNRINVKTVLPLLEDPRINQVPWEAIRGCLCGPCATAQRHANADALQTLLERLRPIFQKCLVEARQALKDTAAEPMKDLKKHPMSKVLQMVRGPRGWIACIPEDQDVDALTVPPEVLRPVFQPLAEKVERELQTGAKCGRPANSVNLESPDPKEEPQEPVIEYERNTSFRGRCHLESRLRELSFGLATQTEGAPHGYVFRDSFERHDKSN